MFRKLATTTLTLAFMAVLGASEARADGYFSCLPTGVVELGNRVHVQCSNSWTAGADTISYIAIDKSDTDEVARFVSMGSAALLAKKIFYVFLFTSSASNVNGCQSTNCRTPTVFGVSE